MKKLNKAKKGNLKWNLRKVFSIRSTAICGMSDEYDNNVMGTHLQADEVGYSYIIIKILHKSIAIQGL